MRIYAAVAAALGWLALVLQLLLMVQEAPPGVLPVAITVVNYLSFFTILTNLLVAFVLTIFAWKPETPWGRFFLSTTVQSATAVYIAIVGVTYSLVLRKLWDPRGAQKLADVLLHDGMPVMYLLFWLLLPHRSKLRWKDPVAWLIYPAVYLAYLLARGAVVGRYPYPFIDVNMLGYPRMFGNAILFMAAFLVAGLITVAISRWVARPRDSSA